MKKVFLLLFIVTLLAELFPAKSTLQLNLTGRGSDQVHAINCHADFYTFIEVGRDETIKKVIILKNSDWEVDFDGPFTWIRPVNEEGVDTSLAIMTEGGKIYLFTLKIVDNEEIFYPKIFIRSEEK